MKLRRQFEEEGIKEIEKQYHTNTKKSQVHFMMNSFIQIL